MYEDSNQHERLQDLKDHLDTLDGNLDDLETCTSSVAHSNGQTAHDASDGLKDLADVLKVNMKQAETISGLHSMADDFGVKLLQVFKNEFTLLDTRVESTSTTLYSLESLESGRHCEAGILVLKQGQSRAQYMFEKPFKHRPDVYYCLSCLSFDLNARHKPEHSDGYAHPWKEPNQIGVWVQVTSVTSQQVTFQVQDLSFGDTVNWETCVSFLACYLQSGKEIVVPEPTTTAPPPDTTPYEADFE